MNKKKTVLISLLILLAAIGITALIFMNEPTAQKSGATKKTAMLVDVINVNKDTLRPEIIATGTVQPAREIILSSRVSGRIISRSQEFTPGGFVNKGEKILQINPADYKNDLKQQKSSLRQAMANLNIEKGRQDVARQDYELAGDTVVKNLTRENQALVLRKPQLESAKAKVEAARASVNQARLNLKRTSIRAPFNAHIISRNVNIGSQVAPGDNLGRLVGRNEYWVKLTLPLSKLKWLDFPEKGKKNGARVKIKNKKAWKENQYRNGYLYKKTGTLEDQTRMAKILVTVPDPLGYNTDSAEVPSLILGSFVEAHIRAKKIPDVIKLNRDYVRKDNTVWVMKNGKLQIRKVNIILKDNQHAYIKDGLKDQEKVVKTNIATVAEGSPLRLESDTTPGN